MKNKRNIFILFFLFNAFFTPKAFTQQNNNQCSNILVTANKEYEAGHFTECIQLLDPCMSNLSIAELFEANRLIALCYLNLKDNQNLNDAIVKLLKSKPDYRDFPFFDPIEFTRLLAKYDVWPKWEIGVKAGININSVNPIKNFSMTGSDARFDPALGYQFGITGEFFLKKNISITTDFLYEGLSYKRVAADVSGWEQIFTEDLNYFSVPIAVRYYFVNWKGVEFIAEIGFQTQLLNSTYSNIILNNNTASETLQFSDIQFDQRTKFVFYGLGGLAAKYKLGGGKICLNVRYAIGLNNIVDDSKRFDNINFIIASQYVDSDISLNPFYVSLGYQFPLSNFYSVKQRK